jgi:antirestriction protein
MERQPYQPNGGEHDPKTQGINTYDTDDPERQRQIEQARVEASEQRKRDRVKLEQLVEQGMDPDEAEALIEFERFVADQRQRQQFEAAAEPVTATPERDHEPQYRPRISVVDLVSPDAPKPQQWIDADQSTEELEADISAALGRRATAGDGQWWVQSTNDFAGLDLHGLNDTALISQLAHGVAEHGAAYAVYAQMVGNHDRDLLMRFEDFYVGSYDSPEAWARAVGDDLEWEKHLDQGVDPMLRPYLVIDYVTFAREARAGWDVLTGADGRTHIFMR